MPAFTIAHITDTHLSGDKPQFVPNFEATLRALDDLDPDLVVNTGDLSVNGADLDADHVHARALHGVIASPWRVVPGNHDVGDNPAGAVPVKQPIDDGRRARFIAQWGQDWWGADGGDFRLIGLNAQLLGSGLAAEEEQWDFLAAEAAGARGRPTALFIHKPLFRHHPAETEVGHRYVLPAARERLLALLGPTRLRLVASGHVHQHRLTRVHGVLHGWGPSTAFILPDQFQPVIGAKEVGFLVYRLDGDQVEAVLHRPSTLADNNLMDFPQPYGSLRDHMAAMQAGR